MTQEIMRLLAELPARGTTVLLVEQNARLALRIAQRGYVWGGARNQIKLRRIDRWRKIAAVLTHQRAAAC